MFAGHVGRTVDWVRKVENNKIDFDRLSVIKSVAEPSLVDWAEDSGPRTIPRCGTR